MSTDAIRDSIELAKLHEQQQGQLARLLQQQLLNNIHATIQLPEEGACQSLLIFVVAYIEHVPNFIDAAREITRQAHIEDYAESFLKLAEDYFLKPPEIVARRAGLAELMDQAYLAHRLIEEVNERFMIRTSIPLVPMDMSMSNLIIHSLIGEPFSNELDEAVNYTVERTPFKEQIYETEAFKKYIANHKHGVYEQKHWPSLTDKLSINLQFRHLPF